MENISSLPIVFFFSQFELNSEHYGLTIRNKVDDLTQVDNETKLYEQAIKTVLDKRMIDIFPEHIKEKLLDLD